MMAALIVVPLSGITGNSFHDIISYAQTANTTKAKQDSLNNTFLSAFDTFVVPGSVNGFGIYQSHNSSIFNESLSYTDLLHGGFGACIICTVFQQ